MGVLNATTVQKLQDFTELPEVYGKNPVKLQAYIDRAEAIIAGLYSPDTGLAGCLPNLELAVNLLAENLVVLRTPDYMRSQIAGFRSETIGSYSYTRQTGASVKDFTIFQGITEEITALLKACTAPGQGSVRSHRTHVFLPRTFTLPDYPEENFYVPEDERVIEGTVTIDPIDPRQR